MVTFEEHILGQDQEFSEASGAFGWMLGGLTLAVKRIEAQIRSAGLSDVYGAQGTENVQGEAQQKLDVVANDAMMECLGTREGVAALVSEEDEAAVVFDDDPATGKYILIFDPLDGSSNIDVNVNVGTIFSIHKRLPKDSLEHSILQPGMRQVVAGYVVYGPSTVLVYTAGHGVHGFTLDAASGAFVLTNENMVMPEQGPYYSVNEANAAQWPEAFAGYVETLRNGGLGREYSSRYIGSLVADFHRTLLKGGVFLYPPTKKQPGGKLRLLYEANPLAFVAEQAGGMATSGGGRILDIQPVKIHQRTAFCVGGKREIEALLAAVGAKG
ncbi:Fructose-1,6-bisphosphatase, type I [Granulicella sibirica]|uniref:Fructose-1,6-bisphosphatase class 1 n=2 Tax=Granulicella sibirica TaxID=2479048 RepID=A0A4Q0T258_9BACT|nr:Fructose-1,6-bisphosphatase, type I [Granulicella sibirica]